MSTQTHVHRADRAAAASGPLSIPGGINVEGTFDWPSDASGAVEGQRVCRFWTARAVFDQPDWTRPYQQYTDTPGGTY
jgi:hypothetical protein